MRRAAFAVTLAVASGALAAPATQPSLTWADWVGDWNGKLTWSGCAVDDEKRASIQVDATDGSIAVDLTSAGGALGKMTLLENGEGFAAKEGDISLRLTRKDAALELAVDLDSGCQLRGTLSRSSVGIAACDQLAAWARIEQQCTKLSRPALENPTRLARQRAEWKKATGDARTKLAEKCTSRAARVQSQLVDVGCAPNPDPNIGMRGAECQALRGVSARVQRCSNVPFDVRTSLEREVVVLLAAMQGADQASIPVVDAECKREREKVFAIAQQAGCPP
ncbi:MAG TPA: hypothetical protein VMZ53_02760 [Kofleriaceae bacterium]|nr:hypothetical protein [Kofleriaceae bacterium]